MPPRVRQARAKADALRFDRSCLDETGKLLAMLCLQLPPGARVAELGTGVGVGTAYLASALPLGGELWTAEEDPVLADAAQAIFDGDPRIHVLAGDFAGLWTHGPFRLLFVDVKTAKEERAGEVIAATAPGGFILLDDLTPVEHWPQRWQGTPDPVRSSWFTDGGLMACELRTSARRSVLLAVRRVDS